MISEINIMISSTERQEFPSNGPVQGTPRIDILDL